MNKLLTIGIICIFLGWGIISWVVKDFNTFFGGIGLSILLLGMFWVGGAICKEEKKTHSPRNRLKVKMSVLSWISLIAVIAFIVVMLKLASMRYAGPFI